MKRLHVYFIIVAIFAACCILSCPQPKSILTEWTVSGTADLTDDDTVDLHIKLAAFYVDAGEYSSDATEAGKVSNVVSMDSLTDQAFSLDIDVSAENPAGEAGSNSKVYLIFWKDDNDDDVLDASETKKTAEPAEWETCNVFGPNTSLSSASFAYFNSANSLSGWDEGWNTYSDASAVDSYTPIAEDDLTGARISYDVSITSF